MTRKVWIGLAAAVVLLLGAAYGLSPFFAAQELKSAVQSGDANKLHRMVDFPAVRESLKSQLSGIMIEAMRSDPEMRDNPFAGLAVAMAPAIIGSAVDAYVTPDGIAAMMAAETPAATERPAATAPPGAPAAAAGPSEPKAEPSSEADVTYRYQDLNTFVISTANKSDPDVRFDFVLYRQGLFDWRLSRIDLPKAAMLAEAAKAD